MRCAVAVAAALACACSGGEPGVSVELTVPSGASFAEVTDTLSARGLVRMPQAFRLYAKLRGDESRVRSGRYALRTGTPWAELLDALVEGRVLTVPMTIPEGFTLAQMAQRFATITELPAQEVVDRLREGSASETWSVPGPGLEGYLFPDTYRFTPGSSLDAIVRAMVQRYREAWTDERRARLEELGMTEREAVTLASIIQAEARIAEEMPRISSVYHNRLKRGYLLQADPTVLYALGGPRERLLYAAIDSVADDPYNTYTQPGLPPGPIGAPGDAALEAALYPEDSSYLYFVARPDGSHVFTRSLAEHNRAKAAARRDFEAIRRQRERTVPPGGDGGP